MRNPDKGLSGTSLYVAVEHSRKDATVRDETAFQVTDAGEKDTLVTFLHFHQDTILNKVAGLSDADLCRSTVPSGLSLIGLLKHATYVHARWFELCFGDESPGDLPWPANEWAMEDTDTVAGLLDAYRRHAELARVVVSISSLDDLNQGWSGGGWEPGSYNLRWIVVHMIEELARHNGHADIIREQIDGATGV
jgi:hypothetical protein